MRLTDKVSIITGAGGGMGRVAALRFAAEGSRVVVADSDGAAARGDRRLGPRRRRRGHRRNRRRVGRGRREGYGRPRPSTHTAGSTSSTTTPGSCPRPTIRSWTPRSRPGTRSWPSTSAGVYLGLQVRHPADGRAQRSRLDHQCLQLRRDPGLLGPAGRLHGVEGRGPGADAFAGRPVRAQRHSNQRHPAGPGRDAAAHGLAAQGRGGEEASAGPQPDRALRQGRTRS